MQDVIWTVRHPLDANLAIMRMEKGQDFGRTIANVFMRVGFGMSLWLPALTRIGLGGKGTGLIFTPNCDAEGLCQRVSSLNQGFFASVSGSITVAKPALR